MALPTLAEVRAFWQIPPSFTDEQLQHVYDGELQLQIAYCLVPAAEADYPDNLYDALVRRCGRALATKGVPLGVTSEEFGSQRLPQWDAEIERLEQPDRVWPLA